MSEAKTTTLIIGGGDVNDISKEDVLAVGVVRAENHMNDQLLRCQKGVAASYNDCMEASKKCSELLQKHGEESSVDEIDRFKATADAMGSKVHDVSVSTNSIIEDGKRRLYRVSVSMSSRTEGRKTGCTKRQQGKRKLTTKRSSSFSSDSDGYMIAPKDAVTQHDLSVSKEAEREAFEKEAMEWKRRLTKIPQYERTLRADLARKRLSDSGEGQELLDLMLGNIEERVLGLPCR